MKEYYTIGELCKIYHFPVSTLRYYYRCGLFEPEYQDPSNGYRYYARDQLYKLDILGLLRVLDIPITDIQELSSQPDFEMAILEYLRDHQHSLQEQQKAIEARLHMIDAILAASGKLDDFHPEQEQITIRHFPARTILLSELKSQPADEREFRINLQELFGTPLTVPELPTVIRGNGMTSSLEYLLRTGKVIYDGAYMEPDGAFGRGNWTVMELPECDCMTLRYRSDRSSRHDAYARMASHIQSHGIATEDMVMEEMLWRGLLSSKKGSDVMELRVILK